MSSKVPFEKASYRAQVSRLRDMAIQVLMRYAVKPSKIEFIHHGENATFCVHAARGRKYLLRIHRGGYHSQEAIGEELAWLTHLSKRGLLVPKPVRSKSGLLLETIATNGIAQGRQCCVFEWVEGHAVSKRLSQRHMYELGRLLARLQQNTPPGRTKHRRYWTAEGLVGTQPKFGPVTNLEGVDRRHLAIVNRVRPKVFRVLKKFQLAHPKRMGLIHADLHFGNILATRTGLAAIDFDDSGFGFYAYDLVIPLLSVQNILEKQPKRVHEFPQLRQSLLDGYASLAAWDAEDEKMLVHLTAARKIAMLGWLNARSDNPRLRAHLKGAAKSAAGFLRKHYL